mmetsp:Transcript_108899/g.259860  ORF Transcript_108899/g.259860 Transcript_108899/m.259860 type:complete len:746 (-) Transcript_108899:64-2301(-)
MAPVAWDRVPTAEAYVAFELASSRALANGASGSSEATAALAAAEAAGIDKAEEADSSARAALKHAKDANDEQSQAAAQLLLAGLAVGSHLAIEAAEHATAAKGLYKKLGDAAGEAKASHFVGWAMATKGNFEEGMELCSDAGIRFRQMGSKTLEALVCYCMAKLFLARSLTKEAAELAEDAVMALKGSSNMLQAYAADLLVQASILKGDSRTALRVAKENFDLFKATGRRREQSLMLAATGAVHSSLENFDDAQKVLDEAQNLVAELKDRRLEGMVLRELAFAQLQRNAADEAVAACGEAMSAYQSAGDRLGEASVLACMVQAKIKKEDFYAASQAANEERAIFQQLGDRSREANCLLTAAGCLCNDNNLDQALALADEALEICQEIEDPAGEAQALMAQAEINSQREDMETAVEKAKEMRRRAKDIGHRLLEAQACKALASVYQSFDRLVEAVRAANEAVHIGKKAMYKPIIVEMMLLASKVNSSLVLQDGAQVSVRGAEKAVRPAREAVTVAKATGKRSLMSTCLYQLAEVQLMSYQLGPAMTSAKEALDKFREGGDKPGEAGAVILIAETHYAGGKHDKAEETVKEGIELAAECSDQRKESYGKALLQQIQDSRQAQQQAAQAAARPMGMPMMLPPQAGGAPAAGAAPAASSAVVEAKQVGLDANMVTSTVQEMARQAIGVDDELYLDSALMDSGMDSLTAVSFRNGLQQQLGVKLPSSLMFDYPTMKEVSNRIVELSIENA